MKTLNIEREQVKHAVQLASVRIIERKLKDGDLLVQLTEFGKSSEIRAAIVNEAAEILNVPYLNEIPRTRKEMYDKFERVLRNSQYTLV